MGSHTMGRYLSPYRLCTHTHTQLRDPFRPLLSSAKLPLASPPPLVGRQLAFSSEIRQQYARKSVTLTGHDNTQNELGSANWTLPLALPTQVPVRANAHTRSHDTHTLSLPLLYSKAEARRGFSVVVARPHTPSPGTFLL